MGSFHSHQNGMAWPLLYGWICVDLYVDLNANKGEEQFPLNFYDSRTGVAGVGLAIWGLSLVGNTQRSHYQLFVLLLLQKTFKHTAVFIKLLPNLKLHFSSLNSPLWNGIYTYLFSGMEWLFQLKWNGTSHRSWNEMKHSTPTRFKGSISFQLEWNGS